MCWVRSNSTLPTLLVSSGPVPQDSQRGHLVRSFLVSRCLSVRLSMPACFLSVYVFVCNSSRPPHVGLSDLTITKYFSLLCRSMCKDVNTEKAGYRLASFSHRPTLVTRAEGSLQIGRKPARAAPRGCDERGDVYIQPICRIHLQITSFSLLDTLISLIIIVIISSGNMRK